MKKLLSFLLCLLLAVPAFSGCASESASETESVTETESQVPESYDVILKGGTVIDGTNTAPYKADIAVKDGRIAKIAESIDAEAGAVYDVSGKTVTPGFVDIHTHSDSSPFSVESRTSKILQGVTTELCGNCGKSPLPYTEELYEAYIKTSTGKFDQMKTGHLTIQEYAARLNKNGFYNNIAMLVGHARLRTDIIGDVDREPTEEELEEMKKLLARKLERGCFGMSLGLTYPPSAFAKLPELIELSKVVASYDGIVSVHMRDEGAGVIDSVKEMLEMARQSGVRLQISHLKILDASNWGKAGELLKLIEDAQAEGIRVTCDQYPFTASSTGLKVLLPDWAQDGGTAAIKEHLANPTDELKAGIEKRVAGRGGAEKIYILKKGAGSEHNNKFLSDVMKELDLSVSDAVIRVLTDTNIGATGIFFSMSEDDVYTIMPQDYICVGSDGSATNFSDETLPHPRNFATFPQFFQTVREKELISPETAVYKCTGLPAGIMGLTDRGVLREGYAADIVVFDYNTIRSNSTYEDSRQRPDGIYYVFVNGSLAVEDNKLKDAKAGRTLLHLQNQTE